MPAVKVHAEKFEQLIDRRGRLVLWEEAELCSCWNNDSGQPSYTCEACHSRGWVLRPGIEATALVMSITLNKDYQEMSGVFEVGDAVMTVPKRVPAKLASGAYNMKDLRDNPMFDIGMHDHITLLDDEYKTSEVLVKGTPIFSRPSDTLINKKVTGIKSIRKYDQVTGLATTYTPVTDYNFVDNLIVWTPLGNHPAVATQYSVVYFHKPTYVVAANLPKPRHQDGQDLPRYVVLRYLIGGVEKL